MRRLGFVLLLASACAWGGENGDFHASALALPAARPTMFLRQLSFSAQEQMPEEAVSRESIAGIANSSTANDRSRGLVGDYLKRRKIEIIFGAVALAAGGAFFAYDQAARSRYEDEQQLYDAYMNAGPENDFDALWNAYDNAQDKTDSYLTLRNSFGIAAGLIGVALVFNILLE